MTDNHSIDFLVGLYDNNRADAVLTELRSLSGVNVTLKRKHDSIGVLLVETTPDGFEHLFSIKPSYDQSKGWQVSSKLIVPNTLKPDVEYIELNYRTNPA